MKKILTAVCSFALILTLALLLVGCGGVEEKKLMTISTNPEVEFLLDENDKVISVNALNEEGNLIISAEAFADVVGMDADAAAGLFIKTSDEMGFIIEGNASAGENEIEISFSGDLSAAKALYNEVKTEIEAYLSSESINAVIEEIEIIDEEDLKEIMAECAPYIDAAKMSYSEMIEQIRKSREETAGFYSQQLKKAYYEAKENAMSVAEIEAIKDTLSPMAQAAIDVAMTAYEEATANIEKIRLDMLVKEDSPYQIALADFREKKIEFLSYKNYVATLPEGEVTSERLERLELLENALDSAEDALEAAAESANTALDGAKNLITQSYNTIVGLVGNYDSMLTEHITEIEAKQTAAITEFNTEFSAAYEEFKQSAHESWADMAERLRSGYTEE